GRKGGRRERSPARRGAPPPPAGGAGAGRAPRLLPRAADPRGDISRPPLPRRAQERQSQSCPGLVRFGQRGEPVAVPPRQDVEDDRRPALLVLFASGGRDDEPPLEPLGRRAHLLALVTGEARQLPAARRPRLEPRLGPLPLHPP